MSKIKRLVKALVTYKFGLSKRHFALVKSAFNAEFYSANNPDVVAEQLDPLRHFMRSGWREERDPSPDFSTAFYLDENQDVLRAGVNPFVHWVLSGKDEGRKGKSDISPEDMARIRAAFDADFYLSQNFDIAESGLDPLGHYNRSGWREGRDPSAEFSTRYYLLENPDVREAQTNPFVHWVLQGRDENRAGKPNRADRLHELHAAFDAEFYRRTYPDIAQSLTDPFEHYMAFGWEEERNPSPAFSTAYYLHKYPYVAESGINPFEHWVLYGVDQGLRGKPESLALLRAYDLPVPEGARPLTPDAPPADARLKAAFDADFYRENNPDIAAQGLDPFAHYMAHGWQELRDPSPNFSTRTYLRQNPETGEAGPHPFAHWVEAGQPTIESQEGMGFTLDAIARAPCPPEDIAAIAERFDEDFYRSAHPEIAESGIDPRKHYLLAGWKLGYDPSPEFSTRYYCTRFPDMRHSRENPFLHYCTHGYKEKRETQSYIDKRLQSRDFAPLVTVIIPNYNHAPYLPQRIKSVVDQGYGPIQLIIMDDLSTDNSRDVIHQTLAELGIEADLVFNEENAGNPFKQWQKGLAMAKGDLIWICESDDFCEPDFLEKIVPWFADESVNIAFGRIQFTDRDGTVMEGLDQYRENAEPGIWDRGISRPARQWFDGAMGVNNMIANVGGCVFRKMPVAAPVWEKVVRNRICGDWLLYLHLAGSGQIAYEPDAVAYFRQHGANTSGVSARGRFYFDEKIGVVREIARYWGTSRPTREKFLAGFRAEYDAGNMTEALGDFETEMRVPDLLAIEKERQHFQLLFLGFQTGGGELFPINLANALLETGHSVSMLALDMLSVNGDMRDRLDRRIPVYHPIHCTSMGRAGYLDACGVDVINTHIAGADAFLYSLDRTPIERPYVVTLHGSYAGLEEAAPKQMIDWILTNVARWIYTADRNLEFFENRAPRSDDFIKLPNAMPRDDRPAPFARRDLGIRDTDLVFTFIARGIKRKGWRASVEAFRALKQRDARDDIALLMVGEGEMAEMAQDLAGETPGIHFLGYQSEINGILRLSDCLILPSRFEGESYPLCLIQSLQEHCPAIATDIGDIRSMMTTDDGQVAGILLENKRNSGAFFDDLADAMDQMRDPERRKAAARIAAERATLYDMDRLAHTYVEMYQSTQPIFPQPQS